MNEKSRSPEECMEMAHIRQEIDKVDDELVALLAKRFGYIDRAWQIKKKTGKEAALVPWRVEQVVERVRESAVQYGLSADLIETVWRRLMNWFIAYEDSNLSANIALTKKGGVENE